MKAPRGTRKRVPHRSLRSGQAADEEAVHLDHLPRSGHIQEIPEYALPADADIAGILANQLEFLTQLGALPATVGK